ncbi:hypothetical protein AC792_12030 [Arthrobacter sp. RIT-PI-e]|uniref:alpha/beta fold hydrolase n=1 Tax=Arthrobacter sp. RIT-PI-e TaxID=1681197 RepID=UPI000676A22C|nr:alpha/beta hydrolase [Arthrobacter sp. RIT-PI-e]KNC18370.1 hypothetical protein AC792_12030 [Arthrobacter sp. RIT-PI-e]
MARSTKGEDLPDITVGRVHHGNLWTRVSRVGTEGERPFLLVSGLGVSSHYFEQLAPHLMQFGPVYALDLPGFGGVPHARHALTISDFAELVGAAIDEVGMEDPVVVGHSMGTQICAELAAARPGLSTLVLISPVVDDRAGTLPVQAVRFVRSAVHEPFRVMLLAVVAYLTCGFGWFLKVLPQMLSYRIRDTAPRIRIPTLIIRGEHDAVSPREWVSRLAGDFPDASTVEIEGAAHSVMHAHAREVAQLCVSHAEGTLSAKEASAPDEPIAVMPELPAEETSLDPGDVVQAVAAEVRGVAIEFTGNHTDDDHLVELGRTQQAEARRRGKEGAGD